MEGGLMTQLAPRPVPQLVPPQFRMDLHYAYHQSPGHDTDRCWTLRHAIQDFIDQGLVNLGQPSVTTNPLPAHSTHAVPPWWYPSHRFRRRWQHTHDELGWWIARADCFGWWLWGWHSGFSKFYSIQFDFKLGTVWVDSYCTVNYDTSGPIDPIYPTAR